MARKAALDIKSLTALGPERLARLVLDEAQRDPAFRKIVKAALAATEGPEARLQEKLRDDAPESGSVADELIAERR